AAVAAATAAQSGKFMAAAPGNGKAERLGEAGAICCLLW
ncbi:hypothetical protein A2U01_0055564, partial [Trifolium medium]|nr:hypothetical protein [Trifolium medium]